MAVEFILSHKQGIALDFLQDSITTEVFYGGGAGCFSGETLITTFEGQKRIDEIKAGDLALTRKGFKKVLAVHDNGIRQVQTYAIAGALITCTPQHKFYTLENDFTPICTLFFKPYPMTYVAVTGNIKSEITAKVRSSQNVYDLTIEEEPEYFANGILVHNSGKSRLGCYWHIKRRLKYPKTRGVLGRAKLGTLLESTFVTFLKVCELLGLKQNREFRFNQVKSKVIWANGSETILKDLFFYPSDPEFQSLGSTEYTDAFVDEAPEVTEKAIEILGSRLRYMLHDYGLKPKMLMTGNPGDHWIKKKYVKTITGEMIELKAYQQRILATLSDNPDKEFVRLYMEQLGKLNEYDKQRLLHGDWDAVPRTGFEYYPQFSMDKHMRKESELPYIPDLPIHFSYDMNEHPYGTLELFQIQEFPDRLQVRCFDEFCLAHPFNGVRALSTAAMNKYHVKLGHNAGAYVYGDYTARKRDSDLGESYNHKYDIIFEVLMPILTTGFDRVVPNANPILRRDLVRDALDGKLPIEILVSEKCVMLKNDMVYLKEGINGTKLKQKERNPITLASPEKYGHCFVGETMITTIDGQRRIDSLNVGDKVLTRKGWSPVINVFDNGIKPVQTYTLCGRQIICTKTHRFYTLENDFSTISFLFFLPYISTFETLEGLVKSNIISGLRSEQNVYDIEVEGEHEYFANGILVHNCTDAFEYFMARAFPHYLNRRRIVA